MLNSRMNMKMMTPPVNYPRKYNYQAKMTNSVQVTGW